ncbi:hypothetical protein JKP88DRAFT_303564 [Tribonema minus]|uniref:Uncharacterized protein n=1 Tax=Tribonema minus TaxID=303371 RepID=A0A836CJG4_9STRA|nr:hypothetical protein JKP88DRAFT_303564 [Tribonema minus]
MEDAEGQEDDPRLAALWKVAVDRLGNDHYHLSLVKEARSVLLREQLLIAQDIADVSDEQLKRAGLTLGELDMLELALVVALAVPRQQEDSRQAAKRKSDEMSMKSYAPSSVDWGKALEAATRLGWRIESRFYDGEDSTREVGEFKWEEKEDDSISRAAVIQELEKQLDLPPFLELIPLERKIMFRIDEERGTKRTRITGKTDYAIVLRHEDCGS